MDNRNISYVVKDNLCTGCGTCSALCPNDAIKLEVDSNKGIYIAKLDDDRCNNCGICIKVCPGHEVNFKGLNLEIFGKESEHFLIGNFINCYIGHSLDNNIRFNSSSGGLVTAILIFALENGLIDGALVTKMRKDKPLEPEPFIARNRDDIIEASKSKYCPVPANIVLKEILNSSDGEKYAVVGLPCHIHGIRKAEQMNEKLKDKIILHIGIFCGHSPNFLATDFLLEKMKIKKETVKSIEYRGGGWPGGVSIILKNGDKLFIPHPHPYAWGGIFSSVFFTPHRCLMCADVTAEVADISFGDAWLPEIRKDDKIGTSIVVSRDQKVNKILQDMVFRGVISIDATLKENVIRSQENVFNFKKKNIIARYHVFRLFHKEIPKFNCWLISDADYLSILCALPFCLNNLVSQKAVIYFLLNHIHENLLINYSSLITRVGHK